MPKILMKFLHVLGNMISSVVENIVDPGRYYLICHFKIIMGPNSLTIKKHFCIFNFFCVKQNCFLDFSDTFVVMCMIPKHTNIINEPKY
jgi:hypothetical protein